MNEQKNKRHQDLEFTGEYFIPGETEDRIEADHVARYEFASQFVKGKSILDIACGVGYGATMLLEAGATKYKGADIQKELISYAKTTYGSDRATFSVTDITNLNINEQFDVITCFETIEHINQYRLAIDNLYQALRPNGTLLISSPNRPITSPGTTRIEDKPNNKFHTQEFTPAELIDLLQSSGFHINANEIYGQRQRLNSKNRYVRKILNIFKPDTNTSPRVQKINKGKTPRYFVIIAIKPIRQSAEIQNHNPEPNWAD